VRPSARVLASLSLALSAVHSADRARAAEPAPACSLEEVLALVREHGPAARSAAALAAIGEAGLISARAWPNPVLEGSFGHARSRDGGDTGSETGIGLVQPFDAPGTRRARIAAGDATAGAATEDARARVTALLETARLAFFDAVLDREEARILAEQESAARSVSELIAARVEAGESAGVEALRARVDLLRLQRLAGSAGTRAELSRARLNSLAAGRLDPACALAAGASAPEEAAEDAALLFERARENDPRVRLARSRVAVAEAGLALARRERLPRFDLGLTHDRELDKSSTAATLGLSLPLWDRNRGALARGTAERDLALAELAAAELESATGAQSALARLRLARGQALEYRSQLEPRAEETYRIARFSFEQGESSLIDLLDAGRVRLEIARESIEVARAYRAAETELLSMTGDLR
jgi:cobalt-zinc-cadmium efflux system outer membrane protein